MLKLVFLEVLTPSSNFRYILDPLFSFVVLLFFYRECDI